MPRILYTCTKESCKKVDAYIIPVSKISSEKQCKSCGGVAKRTLAAPASTSKISIDNGFQTKSVEIIPNIIELNEERRKKEQRRE
jgi:hypothetical protein